MNNEEEIIAEGWPLYLGVLAALIGMGSLWLTAYIISLLIRGWVPMLLASLRSVGWL